MIVVCGLLIWGEGGWREASLDFEAGGVGAVFEEIDGGVRGEWLELRSSPGGLHGQALGLPQDAGFMSGLQAREPRHDCGFATDLQDALKGED